MKRFALSKQKLILFLILVFGFGLRVYGLNWDQGFHLHPDERFLTMVGTKIQQPKSIKEYFDTSKSPLNPYNNGYDFFVYGPFPVFLTKFIAGNFGLDNYAAFNLVGRFLSALFDVGIIFLLFKISKSIWPSFLYSLMVLPIQLSHFFAVDIFLNFFLVLTFYSALNCPAILTGIFLGLALSCKISAILFLPVIGLIFLSKFRFDLRKLFFTTCYLLLAAFLSFRFFSPYSFSGLFKINPQFLKNLKTLNSFNNPDAWYPPAVQWIKTKPIIFPVKNLFFWGLGVPMGAIMILSTCLYIYNSVKRKTIQPPACNAMCSIAGGFNHLTISLLWIFFLFFFQAVQFVKTMRYFLPLYPFLTLMAGDFVLKQSRKFKIFVLPFLFVYPLAFISIYSQPHSRVAASHWIFENIPPGSVVSCEHWDDCLPLGIGGRNASIYQTKMLSLFDQDTEEKWQEISRQLEKIDYLILSSNRLWDSIPKVPERYPVTTEYYQMLLKEELGFKKIKEFTSYPKLEIGNWKLEIRDGVAEEAFTVYDHPKVMIFINEHEPNREEFLERFYPTR